MCGFPPAPATRVTHENQLYAPYNRWSFQNELKLNCTADVWRGNGAVADLDYAPRDLSQVTYHNQAGQSFSFDDMVDRSYTDGIVVLHRGMIIYERYLNGMQPHTLHAWASCSKSMTGTLAAMLAHEGAFEPDAVVATYLPELKNSGFGDATIRQVMDRPRRYALPRTTMIRFRRIGSTALPLAGAHALPGILGRKPSTMCCRPCAKLDHMGIGLRTSRRIRMCWRG